MPQGSDEGMPIGSQGIGSYPAEGRDCKHWGDLCATRGIREVSRGHSSWKQRAVSTTEVSRSNEGLNVELFQML